MASSQRLSRAASKLRRATALLHQANQLLLREGFRDRLNLPIRSVEALANEVDVSMIDPPHTPPKPIYRT